jgi:hypothetical protein
MKIRIILLLLVTIASTRSYAQTWTAYNKKAPDYSFEMPGAATTQDTLNVRFTWFKQDSMTVFQAFEIVDTPFDSANTTFSAALQAAQGDTLMALAGSIASSNGAAITDTQNVSTFPGYKGLEVLSRYSNPVYGRTLLIYTRYFYRKNTLIMFSVSDAEDNTTHLLANKNQFFDSILLQ